jgi:NAD(P)H-hydrate epimerase
VNAETGELYSPSFTATHTAAIEYLKRGLLQWPARAVAGRLTVVPIGIAALLTREEAPHEGFFLLDERHTARLESRPPNAHKSMFGHIVVVGGSSRMAGAPVLSGVSALHSGAGLVTNTLLTGFPSVPMPPELMVAPLGEGGWYTPAHLTPELRTLLAGSDAVVLGPGVGLAEETGHFVREVLDLLAARAIPHVVDADALTHLARRLAAGEAVRLPHAVLTPHPGEAGRLLGIPTSEVERDRYGAAMQLRERTGATIVLKGRATVVRGDHGYVNTSGTPFMATAGSGDVLSGVIATLLAQGYEPLDGAALGVYLHGRAGELAWSHERGPLTAGTIAAAISAAMGEVFGGRGEEDPTW